MNENFKPSAMTEWERIDLQRRAEREKRHQDFKKTLSPLCKNFCVNSICVEFMGSGDSGQIEDVLINFSSSIEKLATKEKASLITQAVNKLKANEHRPIIITPTTDFDVKHLYKVDADPSDTFREHDLKDRHKGLSDEQYALTSEVHTILTQRFLDQVFGVQNVTNDKGMEYMKQIKVTDALDDWCYDQLEATGHDWYNNEGGSGNFVFINTDVDTKFKVELSMQIYRQESDDYDFDL